jgi:hypothetical protein
MNELIKISAKIQLFAGENMRRTPVVSGYRPLFDFMGAQTKLSGKIDLIDSDKIYPNSSDIVNITFIKGIISDNYFNSGTTFTFGEGTHSLGKGEIIG